MQVVLNLVLNAIDATDDQGRIHVAAQAEEGWLVLSVEDDGRGISIADRCRLFQPFFTTKTHGTGLGLFVSRQILEDYAGALYFQSEPGQGSTFFVRLPAEGTRPDEPAMDASGQSPLRTLKRWEFELGAARDEPNSVDRATALAAAAIIGEETP
jgi:K+-sensing histidine kinase KdpD